MKNNERRTGMPRKYQFYPPSVLMISNHTIRVLLIQSAASERNLGNNRSLMQHNKDSCNTRKLIEDGWNIIRK